MNHSQPHRQVAQPTRNRSDAGRNTSSAAFEDDRRREIDFWFKGRSPEKPGPSSRVTIPYRQRTIREQISIERRAAMRKP